MSSHNQKFLLGLLVFLSAMGYLTMTTILQIPTANQANATASSDYMRLAITGLIGYFFGSSMGSADKDKRNNGNT